MTLATRCPACGTVFRVVPDQLRVSQGWVRCGRCSEAFNAQEALVEVPTPASEADDTPARSGPDSARFQPATTSERLNDGFTPPMPEPSSGPTDHQVDANREPGEASVASVGVGVDAATEPSFATDVGAAQALVQPFPAADARPEPPAPPEAPASVGWSDGVPDVEALAAVFTPIDGGNGGNGTPDVVTSPDVPAPNATTTIPTTTTPPIEPPIDGVEEGLQLPMAVGVVPSDAIEPVAASDPAPMAVLPDDGAGTTTAPPVAAIATAAAAAGPDLIEIPHGMFVVATDGAVMVDFARPPDEAGPGETPADEHGPIDRPAATDEHLPSELPAFLHAVDPVRASPAVPAVNDPVLASIPAEDLRAPALAEPVDKPSFLVQAERAARWQRPGVRLTLFLFALLGVAGLTAQVGYVFRDRVAVSAPTLRPLLAQACATWGCRIDDYRQIDALSVESSGLTRVEGAPVYRLAVTLRNRADVEVAAPALDLSLTDALGQRIARRVLRMSDLGMPLRSLKAGSELPIQVPIGIGDRPVSGYTVEIFYP
jgi:predicted Zn finger-like uncharacterized protein